MTRGGKSGVSELTRRREDHGDVRDEKEGMLELVNKVQMFRIAIKKINNKLVHKGKTPVFQLAKENQRDNLKYDL